MAHNVKRSWGELTENEFERVEVSGTSSRSIKVEQELPSLEFCTFFSGTQLKINKINTLSNIISKCEFYNKIVYNIDFSDM
ncbi:Protein of unknown function [Gryllus bimaculatus]|nr:Protein of unknown function [Gryllus bimaculatus]